MNYIQTYSGQRVYLPECDPKSIDIVDIAHALSNACRFGGHTRLHYSVAQHSMACADLVPDEHKLQALLHDGSEAYIGDMPTPFKLLMPDYQALEDKLVQAIATRFQIPVALHEDVKRADRIMLMTERDELCTTSYDWGKEYEEVPRMRTLLHSYIDLKPYEAEELFLAKYQEYAGIT